MKMITTACGQWEYGTRLSERAGHRLVKFLILTLFAYLILVDVSIGDTLATHDRVRFFAVPRTIQDVELIDQDGEPFGFEQLHGKVTIVFFGFTNCPDICPLTMAKWKDLEVSGKFDPDDVEFVFVSVDGDRDEPKVVKKYLEGFSSRIIGLTGETAKTKFLAKQFSTAFYKGSTSGHDGHYDVIHSPQSYVLDQAGLLRAEMYSPTNEVIAAVINELLGEGKSLPK